MNEPMTKMFSRRLCTDAASFAAELGLRRSAMSKSLSRRSRPPAPPPPPLEGPVCRVATAPLRQGASADTVADVYYTEARAVYEASDGFVGALLLFDREESKARSLTLWRDRQSMDAVSDHPDYMKAMTSLASNFADAPDVETWRLGTHFFKDAAPRPQ